MVLVLLSYIYLFAFITLGWLMNLPEYYVFLCTDATCALLLLSMEHHLVTT